MNDLCIQRLNLHGRVPGVSVARAEAIVRRACDEMLAEAIESLDVAAAGEVCIHTVAHAFKLRPGDSDAALAAAWSQSMARALRAALDAGGPNVVRYASRADALADIAASVAAGDFRRAWAWRQLGLWSGPDDPRSLCPALLAWPEAIVPILRVCAQRGVLTALLRALPVEVWARLASAALAAVGGDTRIATYDAGHDVHAVVSTPVHLTRARRLLRSSPLLDPAVRALGFGLAASARRPLAVLVALDADPAGLRGRQARALLAAVERELDARVGRSPSAATPIASVARRISQPQPAADGVGETAHDARSPLREVTVSHVAVDHRPPGEPASADSSADSDRTERTDLARRAAPEALESRRSMREGASRISAKARVAATEPHDDSQPRDERRLGRTAFGGLFYLLHLVDALRLPDELASAGPLAARPLLFVLHRLAQRLVPASADDPAVLGFAGLRPGDAPPDDHGDPPSADEDRALDELATRLVDALARHLDARDEPRDALLDRVCRRNAEIACDPGWLEVRYALEDVDTTLRRAGLDLDPGHLPWLGIVVKFRYV